MGGNQEEEKGHVREQEQEEGEGEELEKCPHRLKCRHPLVRHFVAVQEKGGSKHPALSCNLEITVTFFCLGIFQG